MMVIGLALLLIALAVPAVADEPADDQATDRLRIGLVLGGGGARGAAHVGVIRVLEEANIPIDYVSGTSMGSIVGALYSLGLSADEIEEALLAVDWGALFVDRPPRRGRTMRRKEDDVLTFFPIEFGLRNNRLVTPRGLIAGQKLAFAFPGTGMLSSTHESFDDLPIPYRAVASDLESGEKVVLDHGNLIRAVRASMSIPGIFPPVEIDGRLLVDGYLTSNVPVDAALDMGADYIIAVEVGRRTEDITREDLLSLGGIEEQSGRIQSQRALEDELSRANILIRPQLNEWSGQEYDRLAEIIPLGETAAREQFQDLASLGLPAVEFEAWREKVSSQPVAVPVVEHIEVVNNTRIEDDVIRARLDVPLGEPLDVPRLQDSFEAIYELGLVERSGFDLIQQDDMHVLRVYVHEKPYAPYLVYLGGSYRMSYSGISPFNLHLRINKLEVNRRGAEWRTDLSIGSVFGIFSQFYQPIDFQRRWFAVADLEASLRRDPLYVDRRFIGDYFYRTLMGGISLGRTLGRTAEIRAGVLGGHQSTEWASGLFPIPKQNHISVGLKASLGLDTLDDHRVPQQGIKLVAQMTSFQPWLGADTKYDRLWGQLFAAAGNQGDRFLLDIQGGTDFGTGMAYYQHFYLGGLRAISGYPVQRFRGVAYGLASVGWLHRIGGGELPFSNRTYLGVWADAGNTWLSASDASFDDLIYSGAISLLFETPLGPLHFGYGRSEQGNDAIHLDFGIHLASPPNETR